MKNNKIVKADMEMFNEINEDRYLLKCKFNFKKDRETNIVYIINKNLEEVSRYINDNIKSFMIKNNVETLDEKTV